MITESQTNSPHATAGVYSLLSSSDIDVIVATGPDASKFLQGQLSCNLQLLTPQRTLRGALCNLKGRVIANVRVLTDGTDILLQTAAGMGEVILATLKKYQVFFKTELSIVEERYVLLEAAVDETRLASAPLPLEWPETIDASTFLQGVHITRLPDLQAGLDGYATEGYARFQCLINTQSQSPDQIAAALNSWLTQVEPRWWQLADIASGIAHVHPGQQEQYTPQLLNYDLNGTIDFKKGCYTGQEIVARMFYRAEAKRRMYYGQLPAGRSLEQENLQEQEIVSDFEDTKGQRHILIVAPADDADRPDWLSLPAGTEIKD